MPIFVIFFILVAILIHNIHRSDRIAEQSTKDFWKKESAANNTRKQNIESLNYILLPFDQFPFGVCTNENCIKYENILRTLGTQDILNLTGITNTELKTTYGPSNLAKLAECDEHYTLLVRTLYNWACELYANGNYDAAMILLEYGVEIGTDISGHYNLLARLYAADGNLGGIDYLLESVEALNTINKASIIHNLNNIKSDEC